MTQRLPAHISVGSLALVTVQSMQYGTDPTYMNLLYSEKIELRMCMIYGPVRTIKFKQIRYILMCSLYFVQLIVSHFSTYTVTVVHSYLLNALENHDTFHPSFLHTKRFCLQFTDALHASFIKQRSA